METTGERKCSYCQEYPAKQDSAFCSEFCFELWYSLQQAAVLALMLDKLLDNHISELENANTRPS